MKRAVLAVAALCAALSSLAPAPALADPKWEQQVRKEERAAEREARKAERENDRLESRRAPVYRTGRYLDAMRWDDRQHNGYYYQNRWHYGPPPTAYFNDPYMRPGYAQWRPGAILPGYYRGARMADYQRYRLRPPPNGYAWYRVGDDYLLTQTLSGLVLDVVPGR